MYYLSLEYLIIYYEFREAFDRVIQGTFQACSTQLTPKLRKIQHYNRIRTHRNKFPDSWLHKIIEVDENQTHEALSLNE